MVDILGAKILSVGKKKLSPAKLGYKLLMHVPKIAINSAIYLQNTKLNDQASRALLKPTAMYIPMSPT